MDVKHRIMTSLHDSAEKSDGGGRKIIFKISAAVAGKHTQSPRNGTVLFLRNT